MARTVSWTTDPADIFVDSGSDAGELRTLRSTLVDSRFESWSEGRGTGIGEHKRLRDPRTAFLLSSS